MYRCGQTGEQSRTAHYYAYITRAVTLELWRRFGEGLLSESFKIVYRYSMSRVSTLKASAPLSDHSTLAAVKVQFTQGTHGVLGWSPLERQMIYIVKDERRCFATYA